MTTSFPKPTALSLAEFLQQPETKPASEYIDGRIYQKPKPQGKHSRLQTRFSTAINAIGESQKIACAFTELRCTFAGRSIVPDISVFDWQRIPVNAAGEVENSFTVHPDWTIEILSPDQRPTRVINNILFCLNHGTRLGWLIDPDEGTVIIFQPNQQPVAKEEPAEPLILLDTLGEWQLSVEELFGWLSLR